MNPNHHFLGHHPKLGTQHGQIYCNIGLKGYRQVSERHPWSVRAGDIATDARGSSRSQNHRAGQGPSAQGTYLTGRDDRQEQTQPSFRSQPPPKGQTHYPTAHDQRMASQQSSYHTLLPEQRREQDKWAQIQLMLPGRCPAGLLWVRTGDGYQCAGLGGGGGVHFISDAQLAIGFEYDEIPRRQYNAGRAR